MFWKAGSVSICSRVEAIKECRPDVVETWTRGCWFKMAASTVLPERGKPAKK